MANPIAEAFVLLRPDASGFQAAAQAAIANALGKVTLPSAVQQNIGQMAFTGPGFQAAAQTATTQALKNTKIPQADQRTFAQNLFGPGFRNESGRALQGALVGLGGGQLAAQFAFFGAGGAGLAVLGAAAVNASRDAALLEQQLDILQEVTGATADEIDLLAAEAERLGASIELPAVTATTAAQAMLELSKAGLSVRDVLGGVEGVLQLATAANIDAGTAARIAASALNAFSLAGTEAVHVADLLAGASIAAQGDIGDMALALQQSAAVADQAGLSIDQLVAFITLLAKQGILGSDAGTSIRTSLLRLVPTTKEAAGFMEALGIQLDRTRTLGEQLPDLIDQYQVAISALNPTLRQSTLQQIFGTDAIRAATVAIEGGSKAFRQAQFEIDRQNAALDLAQASTRGVAGSFAGLRSTVDTLSTSLGQDFAPVVEGAITDLNLLAQAFLAVHNAAEDVLGPVKDVFEEFAEQRDKTLPFLDAIRGIDPFSESVAESEKRIRDSGELLRAGLQEAITLRSELLKLGLPTAALDEQIAKLQRQLRQLREEQNIDVGIDLATPLDKALDSARKLKLALEEQGLPVGEIQKQIDLLESSLRRGIVVATQQAAADTAARNQLARALGLDAADVAKLTATVRTEGREAGIALGKSLIEGMTGEITASEGEAIAAARATLESVRREGERQVIESIRSARGNLESLASSLSSDIAEIIDVGPIGQAIDEIDRKLEELQERVSRRQLRFDLRQAKIDLREAQDSIAQVGQLTPAQRRAQQEFLQPFTEKVKDANAAAKEFDLTEQRDQLEKTKAEAIKTAEEGLQRLVADFEEGRVSADRFQRLLANQLSPVLATLKTKAGQNLGLVIRRDFLRDVETLRQQAEALAGFLGRAGTTPGTQVIRPAETQQQVNAQIAAALTALQQTERDALAISKEERDKLDIQIGLLRKLVRLQGSRPRATTTGISDAGDRD